MHQCFLQPSEQGGHGVSRQKVSVWRETDEHGELVTYL